MKYHALFSFLAVAIGVSFFPLKAQNPQHKELSSWYLQQVFSLADANKDHLLSAKEIKQMGKLLAYYMDETNFQRTDTDKDGMLNQSELNYRMGQAIVHNLEKDEKELKKLEHEYPYFSDAKIKYLKRHPELTAKLMENLVWSRTHPDLVNKIISDRSWISQNPKVGKALNRNLIWLTENPETSEKFYRMREAKMHNGYLKTWRSVHKEYMDKHPEIAEEPINIDFPYWPEKKSLPTAENYLTPSTWDPHRAAIDSLISLNKEQKEKYEAQIADLLAEQRQRDSLSQKMREAPLDPVYTGNDIETLKAANEALRKRVKELKIEHKLAMIEEDSLLATTIRQRIKIGLLEKSLELTDPNEALAQEEVKIVNQPVAMGNVPTTVVDLKTQDENKKLLAEIDVLKKKNLELSARMEQLNKEYGERTVAYDKLYQSMAATEKAQANMKFKQDSLRTVFEQVGKENHAKKDSLVVENNLLKQQIELILEENQKLAIAHDQYVLDNESLQDSIQMLSSSTKNIDQKLRQTESQLSRQLEKAENNLADLRKQYDQLSLNSKQQGDSLRNLLAVSQTELNKVKKLHQEAKMKAEQASKVVVDNPVMLEQWQKDQQEYRMRIDELEYNNRKLREEMEATLEVALAKEEIMEKRLKGTLKENQELRFKNQRLKSRKKQPADAMQIQMERLAFEVDEARKKIQQLEETNQALLGQLEANNEYLTEYVQEKNRLRNELGKQMAETALQRSQNDTIRRELMMSSQYHLQDSIRNYRKKLSRLEVRLLNQKSQNDTEMADMETSMDSLSNEIALLKAEKLRIINQNKVDMERIQRSGNKEKALQNMETRLLEREHKIKQQEETLQEKMAILAEKERKYQQLKEWEKNLYLLERKLKNEQAVRNNEDEEEEEEEEEEK